MSPALDVEPSESLSAARERLARLPPFAKMLEFYKVMLFSGEYERLEPAVAPGPFFMLDNVNFSRAVMEDPLPIDELLGLFDVVPGYGTITSDPEVGAVVRAYEKLRASRAAGRDAPDLDDLFAATTVLVTSGATGAIHSLLTGAMLRDRERGGRPRQQVVYNAPCYCLPDAFARAHGLQPVPVEGDRADGFLPSLPAIIRRVAGADVLACCLTFPTNPSMASWTSEHASQFRELVRRCQENDVLLAVDGVFQDVQHGPPALELFALADSPHLLARIASPSKDRPFACGYRVGYAIMDAALEPFVHQGEALIKNSSNTKGLVWLAFDCLFRMAMLKGSLVESDLRPLERRYLFGYGAPEPTAAEMFARISSAGLFGRYCDRVTRNRRVLRSELASVHDWLARSDCFEPLSLPDFGNILMVRVRPPFDAIEDEDLLVDAFVATNVATTTGTCFGLSRGEGVWFRVVAGGAPSVEIISALARLQAFVQARARARPGPARAVTPPATGRPSIVMSDPATYAEGKRCSSVTCGATSVRVHWTDGQSHEFLPIWLRDNCACPLCRHAEAWERTFDLLEVPLEIQPVEAWVDGPGCLCVKWPDGHESVFDASWLHAHAGLSEADPWRATARPFGRRRLRTLSYQDVSGDDEALLEWCEALRDEGLVLIRGAPARLGLVSRLASRIGFVWNHYFGDVFDVHARPDTDSMAYTADSLPPHVDIPSRISQPGYQFLHCVANEVESGEFFLVDGHQIALSLKAEAPESYRVLTETPVEFRFVSPRVDYRTCAPIIREGADGQILAIRFNSFLQAPMRLPARDLAGFYRAYREFLALASDPDHHVRFRFQPGDVVSFDNWCVLHGRESFDPAGGRRHLQGCYMERDELASRIRVLLRSERARRVPRESNPDGGIR